MSGTFSPAVNGQATIRPGILVDFIGLATLLLETVFASVVILLLRVMRPKLPPKHVRLEWFCTCGVQMYADYPESDDVVEFQESLGDTLERIPSFAHIVGDEGRLKLLRVAKNWISVGLVVLLTFTLGACLFAIAVSRDPQINLSGVLGVTALLVSLVAIAVAVFASESSASPSNELSAFSLRSSAQQTGFSSSTPLPRMSDRGLPLDNLQSVAGRLTEDVDMLDTPTYLELCVSRGIDSVHWGEIKLRDSHNPPVDSDASMFGKIHLKYNGLRRKGFYRLLYRPVDVHYVYFRLGSGGRQVGIYNGPVCIPPETEVTAENYHYYGCPLSPPLPMDRRTFFHFLWNHSTHPNSPYDNLFWYRRLPKKLKSGMLANGNAEHAFGWGVHIFQGPNKPVLAWATVAIVVLSFIVSLVYNQLSNARDSGFALGQWMMAVGATSLAAVYFHLEAVA